MRVREEGCRLSDLRGRGEEEEEIEESPSSPFQYVFLL